MTTMSETIMTMTAAWASASSRLGNEGLVSTLSGLAGVKSVSACSLCRPDSEISVLDGQVHHNDS